MTAIVTGATGFIGQSLVEALGTLGEDVRCFVRRPGSGAWGAGAREVVVDYRQPDLRLPDDAFAAVDTVYHLAGATRAVSERAFHEANVAVTERLMDRIAKAGHRPRFVLVSSQAAAGPAADASHPTTERDPARPIEAYGRSKLAGEQAVLSRSATMPVTIVRPVAVYGPLDRDFLSIFRMAKSGWAVYPGIRDSVVNTIYVDDLVQGLIAAARSPTAVGQTYFLGHAQADSWKTIYRTVAEVMGRQRPTEISIPHSLVAIGGVAGDLIAQATGRPLLINGSKSALAAPKFWLCSSGRAGQDFRFTAATSLHDGMRATYDWYLRHRWL